MDHDSSPLLRPSRPQRYWILAVVVALCVGCGLGVWLGQTSKSTENQPQEGSNLVPAYESFFLRAKYVDLTHPIEPLMPLWQGFSPSEFASGKSGRAIPNFVSVGEEFSYADHGFITSNYGLATDQLGTQLDPPAHWNEFGATISDIPASVSIRPLVVIDLHEKVDEDAGYQATVADIETWENIHGRIPEGAVVFFRTDWSLNWDSFTIDGLPDIFPGVSLPALKFLHLERNILFHGHEPLDTDSSTNMEGEAWLMHNDFMQAEGLTNLHLVPEFGALVSIGFAKFQGGSGGYARFVAICPEYWPHGETIASDSGAPLPRQTHPLRRDLQGVLRPDSDAIPTEYCAAGSNALGCPLPA